MKLITFLLLIIAVNCKGQAKDTIPVSKEGLATFRIEALPTYMGVIGTVTRGPAYQTTGMSNVLFLYDKPDGSAPIWIIYDKKWSEKIAYMNPDGTMVIKDTMQAIRELLHHIEEVEDRCKRQWERDERYKKRIDSLFRKNYVVDKKKFDNVVKRIGKL